MNEEPKKHPEKFVCLVNTYNLCTTEIEKLLCGKRILLERERDKEWRKARELFEEEFYFDYDIDIKELNNG